MFVRAVAIETSPFCMRAFPSRSPRVHSEHVVDGECPQAANPQGPISRALVETPTSFVRRVQVHTKSTAVLLTDTMRGLQQCLADSLSLMVRGDSKTHKREVFIYKGARQTGCSFDGEDMPPPHSRK